MNIPIVGSLVSTILFLLLASTPAFTLIRQLGVKNNDVSLIVRSMIVGIVTYLSMGLF